MPVRVRYAPSPTGLPHVGNIRTALFCFLAARHYGGQFLVRLEDTDRERLVEGAYEGILESLAWLGLQHDEGPDLGGPDGPYVQSERLPIYRREVETLIAKGAAYECYCSSDDLARMREEQQAARRPTGYFGRCRDLAEEERVARRAALAVEGRDPVIRFAMPREGTTAFTDFVKGEITFENALIDDFVLIKSDGYPTYNFAHIVDDRAMHITHVMRGDEYIPSMPRYIQLHEALSYPLPVFVHLPLIVGADRKKLSKRHGDTNVFAYRDQGYLPEALANFLALLGWAYDDKTDVFTLDDLVAAFTFEGISANPAVFNVEKLDWLNGVHIRKLSDDDLADRLMPFVRAAIPHADRETILRAVPLIQERLKRLDEAADLISFLFVDQPEYDPALLVPKGADRETIRDALQRTIEVLAPPPGLVAPFGASEGMIVSINVNVLSEPWAPSQLEERIRPIADAHGLKFGQLAGAIRVAMTGATVAPPLFDTIVAVGRDRALARLRSAVAFLA